MILLKKLAKNKRIRKISVKPIIFFVAICGVVVIGDRYD
jgi:hypothetical protein